MEVLALVQELVISTQEDMICSTKTSQYHEWVPTNILVRIKAIRQQASLAWLQDTTLCWLHSILVNKLHTTTAEAAQAAETCLMLAFVLHTP